MKTERPTWYSISVTVAPESSEVIEYAFNSLDALGTEINHLRKKNSEIVTVIGYFNDLPDDERFQDELHYALRAYGLDEGAVLSVERTQVEDTDWLLEWKKHWKPSNVGGFVIAPPWSDVPDTEKIVIRIEPNMAFGTGTHETTQLCLKAIEHNYEPGDSFLDVGTGTGILAIAVARLNLKSQISNFKRKSQTLKSQISNLKLVACDTDVDSISIAKENAELNGVGEQIDFRVGSIADDTPVFDLICANLTLDVIEPLLSLLLAKAGKTLVLSGILGEQRTEIIRVLADLGVSDPEVNEAGEWLCVVVEF